MNLFLEELRLGWAVLALATAGALLPDHPDAWLVGVWIVVVLFGAAVLAHPTSASRAGHAAGELLRSATGRTSLLLLGGLLTLASMVFSLSAALFFATLLGAVCLALSLSNIAGPRHLLAHIATLGAAGALVLFPLELVLRQPRVAREFGLPSEIARQSAGYDGLWTHNVFHFRSRHEQVARRPGRRRILALGDSFTWGLYLGDSDSTWPAVLERRLNAANPASPVEVINMAQRGWTTANEAELLRRLGWQLQPDLVIVQYFVNDAYPSAPDFKFDEPERTYLVPEPFWKGYVRFSSVSALVSLGVNGLLYWLLGRNPETTSMYDSTSIGYRQFKEALREMGDSASARGIPMLFVLFPVLEPGTWTPETYPLRSIYRQVARDARSAGMQVLDLTAAFAAEGGNWIRWWAVPYDSHPSVAAHAVVAGAVLRHLAEERVLPSGR